MLRQATAWLLAQRNASGGFNIDGAGKPTEANSTAIAIRALRAMGRTPSPATRLRAALAAGVGRRVPVHREDA